MEFFPFGRGRGRGRSCVLADHPRAASPSRRPGEDNDPHSDMPEGSIGQPSLYKKSTFPKCLPTDVKAEKLPEPVGEPGAHRGTSLASLMQIVCSRHLFRYHVGFSPEEEVVENRKAIVRQLGAVLGLYIFDGTVLYKDTPLSGGKNTVLSCINKKDSSTVDVQLSLVGAVLPGDQVYTMFYNLVARKRLSAGK